MPTKTAIAFGLVHIPVSLHTATTDADIRFNQLHRETKERIRYKLGYVSAGELDRPALHNLSRRRSTLTHQS